MPKSFSAHTQEPAHHRTRPHGEKLLDRSLALSRTLSDPGLAGHLYKQTIIGILWAILRPSLTMVVFTVIFGRIAKLPSDGSAPYALMVFAAMLPWSLFSNALSESSNSLISNANLIGKVYFPRLIIPAATIVTAFIDFLHQFLYSDRNDGLLSIRTRLAHADAAVLHPPGLVSQYGTRSLDNGA
jgi:hypothetical protein